MTIYYLYYLFVAIVAIISSRVCPNRNRRQRIMCSLYFVGLFLILACRHPSMGIDLHYGDYYGYLGRYSYIGGLSWSEAFTQPVNNYERGYILFNKLLSCISTDPQMLIASCAFFSLLPVMYMIRRLSDAPHLSIYIYMGLPVFMLLFSGLRQVLALGVCCLALTFIYDRKPWHFILTVMLASTFHSTATVFLIAYPVYRIRISREMRVLTIAAFPVVYVFRYQLFVILSKLIKENAVPDDNGAFTLFLVFCLIYVFGIFYTDGEKEENGMLNIFFLACCCQALGGVYSIVIRIGYYFMYPMMLFLPRMIRRNTSYRDSVILTLVIGACFVAFGLDSIKTTSWALAYPYRFFWK